MAKSLRDYRDALVANDLKVYTHQLRVNGESFSIHKSEADALAASASLRASKGANPKNVHEVLPFTPNLTDYWNTNIGDRYDH